MKVENTNALRFVLQDEIYLLNADKSLYSTAVAKPPVSEMQQSVFNYLGGNKKNFLILVHYDQLEFMQDEHLQALESVLSRKGHSRDDVAIVNMAKHNESYEQLTSFFEPKTIVILGKSALPPSSKAPKFNQVENNAGIPMLFTFGFDEMMTNTDNKRAFWEQIKNI